MHFISLPYVRLHEPEPQPCTLPSGSPSTKPGTPLLNRTLPTLPNHRLLKWIEDGIPKDPFLNPDLMKNNPWVEKGKCAIL